MFRTSLATLLLTTVALAQSGGSGVLPEIGISGVVTASDIGAICVAGTTHQLECTEVFLKSSTVDLNGLVGKNVKLFGSQENIAACIVIDVKAFVEPPPVSLELCGTPALGCPIRIKMCPPGLSQVFLFASLESGYAPLNPAKGTFLLGDPLFLVVAGFIDIACLRVDATLPGDASLIGLDIFLQGARKPFGTNEPAQLSNLICFEILPPVIPCTNPNC